MAETLIAWTDFTFNAWMGCTKVSEGCKFCYAETLTRNRMGLKLWGPTAKRQETKGPWKNVEKWDRDAAAGAVGNLGPGQPMLVFLGSLMDWAEDRPDLAPIRKRMWALVKKSKHLTFQMLTKRPENIPNCLPEDWGEGYDNVWLGTTIEDNRVKHRADALRAVKAKHRFISYEPAIGPANEVDLTGIDWVICGGESGNSVTAEKFRPMKMEWARDMRNRCAGGHRAPGAEGSWPDHLSGAWSANPNAIAFFMKQAAAHRTEIDPFLVEADGSQWYWKQYPGHLNPPVKVAA